MRLSKREALALCNNRLKTLQLDHDIAYNNMIASESELTPGEYLDDNSVKLVNEYRRKIKVIIDEILYLQDLDDYAIIGEEAK